MKIYEAWDELKQRLVEADGNSRAIYEKMKWHEQLMHPTIFRTILEIMEDLENKYE